MNSTQTSKEVTLHTSQDHYIRNKLWYVWVCEKTNMIVHSVGSVFPLDDPRINGNTGLIVHELGMINEPTWAMLKKISSRPYYLGLLDMEQQEIIYYKLKATPVGEISRTANKTYHNKTNSLAFKIELLDEHGCLHDNGMDIKIKKITGRSNSKLGDYNFIKPVTTNDRYIYIENGGMFEIKLNQVAQFSIRATAHLLINNQLLSVDRYLTFCHDEYINTSN